MATQKVHVPTGIKQGSVTFRMLLWYVVELESLSSRGCFVSNSCLTKAELDTFTDQ